MDSDHPCLSERLILKVNVKVPLTKLLDSMSVYRILNHFIKFSGKLFFWVLSLESCVLFYQKLSPDLGILLHNLIILLDVWNLWLGLLSVMRRWFCSC